MMTTEITPRDLSDKSPAQIENFVQPSMLWDVHKELSPKMLQNEINVCAMSVFKGNILSRVRDDSKAKFFIEYNQTLIEGFWENDGHSEKPFVSMAIKTRFAE